MDAVRVRVASAQDREDAAGLVEDAGLPLAGFASATTVLVADRGGVPVGTAALERHQDASGVAYLLRSVAVDDAHRGAGVGAALVHGALLAVAADPAPVALLTETAPAWFPRFGFREVPRADLPAALHASDELRGACAVTARAFLLD